MRTILASILLALSDQPAHSEVLRTCGASSGWAYYLAGGVVQQDDAGWQEDGISNGGVMLLRDGENWDIVYTDATGSRSARADGGRVVMLTENTSGVVVLVAYPTVQETYLFSATRSEVVWTQIKAAGLADKGAVFRAACD
jgi:hypothetical protein